MWLAAVLRQHIVARLQAGTLPLLEDVAPEVEADLGFSLRQLQRRLSEQDLSFKDLVERARSKPEAVSYGSSGNGSIQHIAGELFKQLTDTFITHIPYRGAGPALQSVVGCAEREAGRSESRNDGAAPSSGGGLNDVEAPFPRGWWLRKS